ncbi:MAG: ATP-binding cassette domain-containing protein, partial [Actinomycetaceae bacterium]|nr:ATP-binding cassette domain-containing protein [Actinomycetaceae bacterium]
MSARVALPGGGSLTTVDDVSLTLERGKSYAVVGKSGSGKTSLISIIGMLNAQFTGRYLYKSTDVSALSDRERAKLRATDIGFVFQNYSLIKHLSVWENVALPLKYADKHMGKKKLRDAAYAVLSEVGLSDKTKAMPTHLSGGEQQRVAIARAL